MFLHDFFNEFASMARDSKMETRSENLKTSLIQGLHGKDKGILEGAFSETESQVIERAIRRLPASFAVLLLAQVIERLQTNPNKGPLLISWLKNIMLFHTSALMNSTGVSAHLTHLTEILELRVGSHQRLLEISGKLDILLSQIENKNALKVDFSEMKPLQTYTEGLEHDDETIDESEDLESSLNDSSELDHSMASEDNAEDDEDDGEEDKGDEDIEDDDEESD